MNNSTHLCRKFLPFTEIPEFNFLQCVRRGETGLLIGVVRALPGDLEDRPTI
jgi:hypothetical protein